MTLEAWTQGVKRSWSVRTATTAFKTGRPWGQVHYSTDRFSSVMSDPKPIYPTALEGVDPRDYTVRPPSPIFHVGFADFL